jgi:hypothetical protein
MVATLIDGEVNLANCTEAFLHRQDVQALLAKTTYLEKVPGTEGFVRVRTVTGEAYEQALVRPPDLTAPDEIKAKFFSCAVPVIGLDKARQIDSCVAALEGVDTICALTRLFY